jgi:ATP-dependent DNA ligase
VVIESAEARVFTRKGHNWSDRYPGIVRTASQLNCRSAIIDGEAVVQDPNGVSDFERLQSAIRSSSQSIILYAFDLLHLEGHDIRHRPLIERRSMLQHLLGADADSRIQFSEEFTGEGAAFFKACVDTNLEGMVSKHVAAPYRSGRTKTWLKCKCFTESTFLVVGTDRDPRTGALRALLAHPDSAGLNYAGAAFIALAGDERAQFFTEVDRFTTSWALFKSSRLTDVRWCHPKLTVVVKHLVGSKMLRHATVKALERQ